MKLSGFFLIWPRQPGTVILYLLYNYVGHTKLQYVCLYLIINGTLMTMPVRKVLTFILWNSVKNSSDKNSSDKNNYIFVFIYMFISFTFLSYLKVHGLVKEITYNYIMRKHHCRYFQSRYNRYMYCQRIPRVYLPFQGGDNDVYWSMQKGRPLLLYLGNGHIIIS